MSFVQLTMLNKKLNIFMLFEGEKPRHIISRAVDERVIFADEADCYRFIFQIYAANYGKPAANFRRADVIKTAKSILAGGSIADEFIMRIKEIIRKI